MASKSTFVEKEGYLWVKRSRQLKVWKWRYAVLKQCVGYDRKLVFEWFENQEAFQSHSSPKTNRFNSVSLVSDSADKKKDYAFMFYTDSFHQLELAAKTEAERFEWQAALKKFILVRPRTRSLEYQPSPNHTTYLPRPAENPEEKFLVTFHDSTRPGLLQVHEDYWLHVGRRQVTLTDTKEPCPEVLSWLLEIIKSYDSRPYDANPAYKLLTIETGRRSATGRGDFHFLTPYGDDVKRRLRSNINMLRPYFIEKKLSVDTCDDSSALFGTPPRTFFDSNADRGGNLALPFHEYDEGGDGDGDSFAKYIPHGNGYIHVLTSQQEVDKFQGTLSRVNIVSTSTTVPEGSGYIEVLPDAEAPSKDKSSDPEPSPYIEVLGEDSHAQNRSPHKVESAGYTSSVDHSSSISDSDVFSVGSVSDVFSDDVTTPTDHFAAIPEDEDDDSFARDSVTTMTSLENESRDMSQSDRVGARSPPKDQHEQVATRSEVDERVSRTADGEQNHGRQDKERVVVHGTENTKKRRSWSSTGDSSSDDGPIELNDDDECTSRKASLGTSEAVVKEDSAVLNHNRTTDDLEMSGDDSFTAEDLRNLLQRVTNTKIFLSQNPDPLADNEKLLSPEERLRFDDDLRKTIVEQLTNPIAASVADEMPRRGSKSSGDIKHYYCSVCGWNKRSRKKHSVWRKGKKCEQCSNIIKPVSSHSVDAEKQHKSPKKERNRLITILKPGGSRPRLDNNVEEFKPEIREPPVKLFVKNSSKIPSEVHRHNRLPDSEKRMEFGLAPSVFQNQFAVSIGGQERLSKNAHNESDIKKQITASKSDSAIATHQISQATCALKPPTQPRSPTSHTVKTVPSPDASPEVRKRPDMLLSEQVNGDKAPPRKLSGCAGNLPALPEVLPTGVKTGNTPGDVVRRDAGVEVDPPAVPPRTREERPPLPPRKVVPSTQKKSNPHSLVRSKTEPYDARAPGSPILRNGSRKERAMTAPILPSSPDTGTSVLTTTAVQSSDATDEGNTISSPPPPLPPRKMSVPITSQRRAPDEYGQTLEREVPDRSLRGRDSSLSVQRTRSTEARRHFQERGTLYSKSVDEEP